MDRYATPEKIAQYRKKLLPWPCELATKYAKNRTIAVTTAREYTTLSLCNSDIFFSTRGAIKRLKYPCGIISPVKARSNVMPANKMKTAAFGIVWNSPASLCLKLIIVHVSAMLVHKSVNAQRLYMPFLVLASIILYMREPRNSVFSLGGT